MRKLYLIIFVAIIGAWSVNAQKEMSKAGWSISTDSEYSGRLAVDAIDEDLGTFWHNDWSVSDPLPHWLVVDFGEAHDINGFSYAPRSSSGGNGTFKEYAFFVSADSITWDSIAGGTWAAPWGTIREVAFNLQTGIRYMKLVAKSNNTDNSDWATCSEFGALVPGTKFAADVTSIIRLGTVNFTDLSGNSPTGWEWTFAGGNPATSTEQNPSVSYPTVGQFDVTLITKPDADPANNDTVTMTNYITVLTGADFEADQTTIMRGATVNFSDSSGNSPVAWYWAFEGGNPATSSEQNPSVVYDTDGGQYDVMLVSIPDAGDPSKNDTIRKTNYITVDLPHISQADWDLLYEDSYQGTDHATNIFDGDPGTIWHTEYSPNLVPYPHEAIIDLGATYSINGFTYTPRSGGGNGTVKDYEFYITKDTSNWGSPVYVGAWSAPWDVDHKTFLPSATIGRYVKWVTLSERNDGAWTSCAELNVMGGLFGSAFEADRTEIMETNSVQFTDKSSYIPSAYEWIFDGGTPATSTERSPSVVYEAAGTYTVTLITTPASGAGDNDTLVKTDYITVNPRPNTKKLSRDGWSLIYVDSEHDGRPVTNIFDGDYETFWHTEWSPAEPPYPHEVIIDLGADYDLTGFMYAPRSGGGNGTVAQYEFYTSLDADIYTLADSGTWADNWASERTQDFDGPVTARFIRFVAISEKNGNLWASCSELNVLVAITGAEFQSDVNNVIKGGTVYYTDLSAGDPTSWSWVFEGGTPATSTERSPKVVYNDLGVYDVSLTVDGTVFTEKLDYINVNYDVPQIGTGVYLDSVMIGNVLAHFSGQEGGYVDNTDIVTTLVRGEVYMMNVTHIVPWDGYDSRQGAWVDWNNDGVFDTETELIMNDTLPSPFLVPADAVLGNTRMRVLGRLWAGDPDPYAKVDYGEIEDYTINIVELSGDVPVADFAADSTSICAQTEIGFVDLSTNTPTSWAWTFEGGTPATSDMQHPVVFYDTPGTYEVSLTATQASGSGTETKAAYITVNAGPVVSAGDDQEVCQGTMVTLSGSGADVYVWDNGVVDGVPFEQTADSVAYIVTGISTAGCENTDTVIVKVKMVDVAVSQSLSSDTLTANATDATYQWINCADNSEIDGATAQEFVATDNGDFAVVVTQNECSDTSTCFTVVGVGIGDNSFGAEISIYPNPNNGNFTVKLGIEKATINVYNALGSLVYSRKDASKVEQLSLSTKGLYFIEIRTDKAVETRRVIVQ